MSWSLGTSEANRMGISSGKALQCSWRQKFEGSKKKHDFSGEMKKSIIYIFYKFSAVLTCWTLSQEKCLGTSPWRKSWCVTRILTLQIAKISTQEQKSQHNLLHLLANGHVLQWSLGSSLTSGGNVLQSQSGSERRDLTAALNASAAALHGHLTWETLLRGPWSPAAGPKSSVISMSKKPRCFHCSSCGGRTVCRTSFRDGRNVTTRILQSERSCCLTNLRCKFWQWHLQSINWWHNNGALWTAGQTGSSCGSLINWVTFVTVSVQVYQLWNQFLSVENVPSSRAFLRDIRNWDGLRLIDGLPILPRLLSNIKSETYFLKPQDVFFHVKRWDSIRRSTCWFVYMVVSIFKKWCAHVSEPVWNFMIFLEWV